MPGGDERRVPARAVAARPRAGRSPSPGQPKTRGTRQARRRSTTRSATVRSAIAPPRRAGVDVAQHRADPVGQLRRLLRARARSASASVPTSARSSAASARTRCGSATDMPASCPGSVAISVGSGPDPQLAVGGRVVHDEHRVDLVALQRGDHRVESRADVLLHAEPVQRGGDPPVGDLGDGLHGDVVHQRVVGARRRASRRRCGPARPASAPEAGRRSCRWPGCPGDHDHVRADPLGQFGGGRRGVAGVVVPRLHGGPLVAGLRPAARLHPAQLALSRP